MKPDPVHQKIRDIAWRRRLTPAEQAELQAWLVTHPEAQAEVELDAVLDAALASRATPSVSSNFTARVMQAIEAETKREIRPAVQAKPWWHRLVPRVAVAALIIAICGLVYRQNLIAKQNELARAAKEIAVAQALSSATVIQDFEVIRSLTPATMVADENLLALSDELLAIHP
jgi:anti-sigma factor RsiW